MRGAISYKSRRTFGGRCNLGTGIAGRMCFTECYTTDATRKRIVCEGDGCKVEDGRGGELFLTGTLVNKAIYVDLLGRNEVRPLGGSMKETGLEEVVFLHGISDKATIERWHA